MQYGGRETEVPIYKVAFEMEYKFQRLLPYCSAPGTQERVERHLHIIDDHLIQHGGR
jgi:hypothetical protein